jgi:hypothetical protein
MIGQDLKLLIKSIPPSVIMDAAITVAQSQWVIAGNNNDMAKHDWVEERAISMFRQLKEEVNTPY